MVNREKFSLFLGLIWTKQVEFINAHQWIGSKTRRRKPTYLKISKFWEMIEQLKVIGYEEFIEGYNENPYSFTMSMYHQISVRIDSAKARGDLLIIICKTVTILREANPWIMPES